MAGDEDKTEAPAVTPPPVATPPTLAPPAAAHIAYGEAGSRASAEALAAAVKSGNVTVQDANAETLALPAVRAQRMQTCW